MQGVSWPEIAVLLLSVPLIATLHEGGHALAARPAGFRLTSMGVGRGRVLARYVTKSGITFYLGRHLWSGGACVAIPLGPLPAGWGLYYAGGILAQCLLAALLALSPLEGSLLAPLAGVNVMMLLINLLPWRFGPYTSDGWQLLVETRGALSAGTLLSSRHRVERLMRFEQEVGSGLGASWCQLTLAWVDLLVGRLPEAAERLSGAAPGGDLYLEAVHTYLSAELARLQGLPLRALQGLRELKRARGAALPDSAADLLSIAEARAYLALGETGLARQALSRLVGVSGIAGRDAQVVSLQAALAAGEGPEIAASARRLSARVGAPLLEPVEGVKALWEAARFLDPGGQGRGSRELRAAASRTAAHLIAAADVEDRIPLVKRLGEAAGLRIQSAAEAE